MALLNILKAILVRVILLCHTLLSIWRVTRLHGELYYLLTLALVPFILEGLYRVIRRRGIEKKWLCPCFFFFLLAALPNVWLLEIERSTQFGNAINSTAVQEIKIIGIKIPLNLSADTWVLVLEESLIYAMIIGRWLLPRGKVSREQLSELLFTFVGIASDIMELFALFDEQPVRQNIVLTYALLGLWSWSLFQFTMVLTVAARPIRINLIEQDNTMVCIEPDNNKTPLEVMATFISLCMQDGPFLILRLYIIIKFNIINYSLLFFTLKNILVILLLLYRLLVKCCEVCSPEEPDSAKKKDGQNKFRNETGLTKDEIIAALLSDANTVRKRRGNKIGILEDEDMDGRNSIDANADLMERIVLSELPTMPCTHVDKEVQTISYIDNKKEDTSKDKGVTRPTIEASKTSFNNNVDNSSLPNKPFSTIDLSIHLSQGISGQNHLHQVTNDQNHLPQVTSDQNHVPQVSSDQNHLPQGTIDQNHLSQGISNQNHLPQGTNEQNHLSQGISNQNHLPQGTNEQNHLSQGISNQNHLPQGTNEQNHFSQGISNQNHLPQGTNEQNHLSQGISNQNHLPQGTNEQNHLSQGISSQNHLPQGTNEQNHLSQGISNQNHLPQGTIDQKHLSQGISNQNYLPQGTIDQNHLPLVTSDQDHLPQAINNQNHLPQVTNNQNHLPQVTSDANKEKEIPRFSHPQSPNLQIVHIPDETIDSAT